MSKNFSDSYENFIDFYDSPLGEMTLLSDSKNLTGLHFENSANPRNLGKNLRESNADSRDIFAQTKQWLDLYFSGKIPPFTPKLALKGSDFALRVWEILLTIPHGATMSYGEIARQIAREKNIAKMSAQAVGGAISRNPIAIIVPCHRVIGVNGNLTGYAGGMARKIALLRIEGVRV